MSFAGHAYDAIKRIESNRALLQMHRARYNELKESVIYIKAKYPHKFIDSNNLSDSDLKKLKKKIKLGIIKSRRKKFVISLIFTSIICYLVYFISYNIFIYFYNS